MSCKDDKTDEVKPAQAVKDAVLTPAFQQLTLSWTNPDPENVEYVEISYMDVDDEKQTVRFDIKGGAASSYSFSANDLRDFEVTLVTVTKDGQRSEPVVVSGRAKITSKYNAILETVEVVAYGDFGVMVTWENTAQTVATVVITYGGQTVQCNAVTESEKLFSGLSPAETVFMVDVVNGDEKSSAPRTFSVTPMDLQSRLNALLASVMLTVGDPIDFQTYTVWAAWDNTIEVEAEIALSWDEQADSVFNSSAASGAIRLTDGDYQVTVTVTNAGQTSAYDTYPLKVGTLPFNGPHNIAANGYTTLKMIDFDEGGEGFAYHDADDVDNYSNRYRTAPCAVDIDGADIDAYHIAGVADGEWLVYTVNVAQAGTYQLDVLFAAHSSGQIAIGKNNPGYIHIDVNGQNVSGPVAVPDVYSWTLFRWMPVRKISLQAGKNKIRVTADLAQMNMKALRFSPAPAEPTIIGKWTFENASNLFQASEGSGTLKVGKVITPGDYWYAVASINDMPLSDVAFITSVEGPNASDKAILLPEEYFVYVDQGLAANGGGSKMNEYTIVLDFIIPTVPGWVTLLQVSPTNYMDGAIQVFCNNPATNCSRGMGWGSTADYIQSNDAIADGVWYRYVLSAACGGKWITQYLNGRMFNAGPTDQSIGITDSEWLSLDPAGVIFFGDDSGEEAEIKIAGITIYNGALSRDAVEALGGFSAE
jgi:hypothetical protein